MANLNPLIGTPDFCQPSPLFTATVDASVGSWLAARPASNVLDERLHHVARSTNDDAASTKIEIDLGVARAVRVIAIYLPNISKSGATVRIYASDTANDFSGAELIYDSTALAAHPSGIDAEECEGYKVWFRHITAAVETARYWLIEIVDTSNADGYVDVGQIMICGGLQLTNVGIVPGAKAGFDDDTKRYRTEGGPNLYKEGTRPRTFDGVFTEALEAEVYDYIHRMQKRGGISRRFFWVENPDDTTRYWQKDFRATFRQLSPVERTDWERLGVALSVGEEL